MLDLQTLGQHTDAGLPARLAAQRQEQLVLLRLDSSGARRLFAEVEKAANMVPEFRERAIISIANTI